LDHHGALATAYQFAPAWLKGFWVDAREDLAFAVIARHDQAATAYVSRSLEKRIKERPDRTRHGPSQYQA
jgi:hypothetical protein